MTIKKCIITHTLTGESFINQLLLEGEAKFSVALFYKNSAHRQTHAIDDTLYNKDNKITADQIIDNDFSYTPEINANIVIAIDKEIVVNSQSGLSGFCKKEKHLIFQHTLRLLIIQHLT